MTKQFIEIDGETYELGQSFDQISDTTDRRMRSMDEHMDAIDLSTRDDFPPMDADIAEDRDFRDGGYDLRGIHQLELDKEDDGVFADEENERAYEASIGGRHRHDDMDLEPLDDIWLGDAPDFEDCFGGEDAFLDGAYEDQFALSDEFTENF